MVLIATFNNISVISWRPVLLVDKIEVPGENHRPTASQRDSNSHSNVGGNMHWFS